MTSLWFVVPVHGRPVVAEACLRQLHRTCEALTAGGIDASAVVVGDDENLETARALGFGTVERDNTYLGRKFNDGYEACGLAGVDFAVPFGSDDWIDPDAILHGELSTDTIRCFRLAAFVREDGGALAPLRIPYDGGVGIRVIPVRMLERLSFRPAEDDRKRAIDASVQRGISRALGHPPAFDYADLHPLQIVDFKSHTQLNTYQECLRYLDGVESDSPFDDLAGVYPSASVAEMRDVYAPEGRVAAWL